MPLRQEAQFLRQRARRLREMATTHQTALSDQLLIMAAELEARADQLEKAEPPSGDGPLNQTDRLPNFKLSLYCLLYRFHVHSDASPHVGTSSAYSRGSSVRPCCGPMAARPRHDEGIQPLQPRASGCRRVLQWILVPGASLAIAVSFNRRDTD